MFGARGQPRLCCCLWLLLSVSWVWLPLSDCQSNWFSPFAFDLLVAPIQGYLKLHDPLTPLVAVSALGLTKAVLLKRIMSAPQAIQASEFNAIKTGVLQPGKHNSFHKYLSSGGHLQQHGRRLGRAWRKGLRSFWTSASKRNHKRMQDTGDMAAQPRTAAYNWALPRHR